MSNNKFLNLFKTKKPIIAKITINDNTTEETSRIIREIIEILKKDFDGLLIETNNSSIQALVRLMTTISKYKRDTTLGLSLPNLDSELLYNTANNMGFKFVVINEKDYGFTEKTKILREEYSMPTVGRISNEGNFEHNVAQNIECCDSLLIDGTVCSVRSLKERIIEGFPVIYETSIMNLSNNIGKLVDADCSIVNVSTDKKESELSLSHTDKLLNSRQKVLTYGKMS